MRLAHARPDTVLRGRVYRRNTNTHHQEGSSRNAIYTLKGKVFRLAAVWQSGFEVLIKARRWSHDNSVVGLKRVQMRVYSAAGQPQPTALETTDAEGDRYWNLALCVGF